MIIVWRKRMTKTRPCEKCGDEIFGDNKGNHILSKHPEVKFIRKKVNGRQKLFCGLCPDKNVGDYKGLFDHYKGHHVDKPEIPAIEQCTQEINDSIESILSKFKGIIDEKNAEIELWKNRAQNWAAKLKEMENQLIGRM